MLLAVGADIVALFWRLWSQRLRASKDQLLQQDIGSNSRVQIRSAERQGKMHAARAAIGSIVSTLGRLWAQILTSPTPGERQADGLFGDFPFGVLLMDP